WESLRRVHAGLDPHRRGRAPTAGRGWPSADHGRRDMLGNGPWHGPEHSECIGVDEMTYNKQLPIMTDGSQPFWDACRRHELVIQECRACWHRRWPIGPVCTECLSPEFEWVRLPGTGEVWSWIVYHRAFNPAWADDVPYNVALIRLDGAHTMISNLIDVEPG